MRKRLLTIFILLCGFLLCGCSVQAEELNANSYLRIHIRANSNLEVDQNIKYSIKDAVVEYLTPKIANVKTKEDALNMVNGNKENIESLANNILKQNNFKYVCSMELQEEFFPTRVYGEYSLPADFYDAIILNLGEAKGDNWWCVVYPPLCFVGNDNLNVSGFKYKSKLWEIINNFFN